MLPYFFYHPTEMSPYESNGACDSLGIHYFFSLHHLHTKPCCQTQAIRFAGQFGILTCMWKGDSITGALHIIVKWGHLAACVCSPTVYLRQRSMGLILFHWLSITFLWVPLFPHQPATTGSLQGWVKVTRPLQPMHYGPNARGRNDLILFVVL